MYAKHSLEWRTKTICRVNPLWFSLVGRCVVKPVILSRKTGAEGRVQDQDLYYHAGNSLGGEYVVIAPLTTNGGGGVNHWVHRVAMTTFWRTLHHDGKISPGWWGWRCMSTPFHYIYHHVQSCIVFTSAERSDTLPLFFTLRLYVLCGFTQRIEIWRREMGGWQVSIEGLGNDWGVRWEGKITDANARHDFAASRAKNQKCRLVIKTCKTLLANVSLNMKSYEINGICTLYICMNLFSLIRKMK